MDERRVLEIHLFHGVEPLQRATAPERLPALDQRYGLDGFNYKHSARAKAQALANVGQGHGAAVVGLRLSERFVITGSEAGGIIIALRYSYALPPNPYIERTRKGKARYAPSLFSASRALPSRASHVKR